MEQCVREPASVYNNRTVNTQPVIKQEFPKYQCERNSTYQNDSFKKEISKKLFAKAGPSLDKILSCSRVNLSISQSLVLNYVEAERCCRSLLKIADIPDTYLTLLDAAGRSPTLVLDQSANTKQTESWALSKSERQKFQRWYPQGAAAKGPVRNLSRTSNLSASKLRKIFQDLVHKKNVFHMRIQHNELFLSSKK